MDEPGIEALRHALGWPFPREHPCETSHAAAHGVESAAVHQLCCLVTPDATPGVTSYSDASDCASFSFESIPWRVSCRDQMRARTFDGGWRSSTANIIRRSTASQVSRALFEVHRWGQASARGPGS